MNMQTSKTKTIASVVAALTLVVAASAPSLTYAQPLKFQARDGGKNLSGFSQSSGPKRKLVAPQGGKGDEYDDCMNNPDNADQDFIERMAACFCLATGGVSDGC